MAEFPPKGRFNSNPPDNFFTNGRKSKILDPSDVLANDRHQFIEFQHVPTGDIVRFKAYITEFRDNYGSDWNDEKAFGRMDPISTFKGTGRIITISWELVAASLHEAVQNWERLSMLLSFLYPTYEARGAASNGATTIKNSPLFRLKFMNLIQRADRPGVGLLGKVTGFENNPDMDHGFFDPLGRSSNHANIYPQTINLSAEFTVLHEHELGFSGKDRRQNFSKFPYGSTQVPFVAPGRRMIDRRNSRSDTTGARQAKRLNKGGG